MHNLCSNSCRVIVSHSVAHIPYEIPQATTRDCKHYFDTANYSRISHVVYHKGGSNANDKTSIFDVNNDYVIKSCASKKHYDVHNVYALTITTIKNEGLPSDHMTSLSLQQDKYISLFHYHTTHLCHSWRENVINIKRAFIMYQSFVAPAPSGPRNSGAFNFSIFKALLKPCTAGPNLW